ncbi:MAG: outer membrane beta-barrel protein [Acidobacteriaceae bacterium]
MRRFLYCMIVCMLACVTIPAFAQATNSGDIRGTVTDETGAVIPGVTVTVLNVNTQVLKEFVTDSQGVYDTSSIVTGSYKITFKRDGFKTLVRGPITVQVGVTGLNAQLPVGAATQQIVVNTDVPLLKTENGEQSTTLNSKALVELPQTGGGTGQDWQNFIILLPGASGTPTGSQGSANPGQVASINGNLPYSNVLADGASTTLSHSQNSDVSTLETVAELQVITSAFSAQYGVGGAIFNQISKGGTNKFHGSAYDYFENDKLNSAQYGFGHKVPVPYLRYNEFGGSIGGPILKKKMFFYFNYDRVVNHGSAGNHLNTVPTEAVKAGDFSGQSLIYDPTTQVMATDAKGNQYPIRKSFLEEYGTNAIPSSMFDSVAAAFQKFYPTPSNHIAGSSFVPGALNSAGLLQNNFFSSLPRSTPYVKYFGRLDYDITPTNRLTMSDTQRDTPVIYPNSVTACPVGCQSGDVDSNNAQITDVWNISPNTINEARLGYTYQGNFFADLALNKGYAAQLGWKFAKADDLPAIQFGPPYPYAWIQPSSNAVYKEHVFDPSDVVTMIRGKHILHFGGEFLMYRDDSTAWGNTNAGAMNFSGEYTRHWSVNPSTGVASPDAATGLNYADFLLGDAQSWNANVRPEYGARLKSPQMFIQDDYKIRPNLTLNLGLRYQINHGWNEVHNDIRTFDPTVVNPATGTNGAMWYAGTHANGRTSLQANVYNTILPRFGFSWQPKADTTIRGGFGVYSYNWSLDTYGSGMGDAIGASGSSADQTNGITPIVKLDSDGANLPYNASTTDPAKFNNSGVGYNQYHTPVPKIYQWTLSAQRELGSNTVVELAYVASHGFNLAFPVDINQIPENKLGPNAGQSDRPYPQYQGINGSTNNGISNYNSLQTTITKRLSSGLSFSFNYTWSHMLDDQDSSGWGSRAGNQPYQIALNPSANYSNSNFDVRNAFKGHALYELPFGRGRMFLNNNALLDEVIGGWQLAGTVVLSSGNPFTLTTNGTTYAKAGSQYPNRVPGVSTTPRGGKSIHEWYNPAAFSLPANGTFGNVRRNSLYGPGLEIVNLSLGKDFRITEQVRLRFRADASNAFNHPSFGLPNRNLSGVSPGQSFNENLFGGQQINGTTVGGRTMQLGAHLSF